MRLSDDGEPLVHRVRTDREDRLEAQQGLDVLLKKVHLNHDRDARERAAKASGEELEAIRTRRLQAAAALAARFEWRPVATVALFDHQTCSFCGSVQTQFRGFATLMQRQADKIVRLAAAPCLDHGLPYQEQGTSSTSPCCIGCIEEQVEAGKTKPPEVILPTRPDYAEN